METNATFDDVSRRSAYSDSVVVPFSPFSMGVPSPPSAPCLASSQTYKGRKQPKLLGKRQKACT